MNIASSWLTSTSRLLQLKQSPTNAIRVLGPVRPPFFFGAASFNNPIPPNQRGVSAGMNSNISASQNHTTAVECDCCPNAGDALLHNDVKFFFVHYFFNQTQQSKPCSAGLLQHSPRERSRRIHQATWKHWRPSRNMCTPRGGHRHRRLTRTPKQEFGTDDHSVVVGAQLLLPPASSDCGQAAAACPQRGRWMKPNMP